VLFLFCFCYSLIKLFFAIRMWRSSVIDIQTLICHMKLLTKMVYQGKLKIQNLLATKETRRYWLEFLGEKTLFIAYHSIVENYSDKFSWLCLFVDFFIPRYEISDCKDHFTSAFSAILPTGLGFNVKDRLSENYDTIRIKQYLFLLTLGKFRGV